LLAFLVYIQNKTIGVDCAMMFKRIILVCILFVLNTALKAHSTSPWIFNEDFSTVNIYGGLPQWDISDDNVNNETDIKLQDNFYNNLVRAFFFELTVLVLKINDPILHRAKLTQPQHNEV
jgi:hypothetical protein